LRVNPGIARVTVVGLLLVALSPSAADADWNFAPFIGGTFAGSTAVHDPEQGASSVHLLIGGSAGWWSESIIGLEGDFSYAPRFFETDNLVVSSSNVITLGGNVVVAMPVSVTRESLRPYLVGGLGWMHFSLSEAVNVLPELFGARNSLALNLGGGAVGFINPRTGFRFEVRQFRSLEHGESSVTAERQSLLSFWRVTVGVVIRP
jgi:hypothetical protein